MKINYHNYIKQLLPPLKRLPARLDWFQSLLQPLIYLWLAFVEWRNYQRMLVNVYCCRIVLEGFLRAKYGTQEIFVTNSRSGIPKIGLRAEGRTSMRRIGLRSEVSRLRTLLRSEGNTSLDVDFIVFIPANVLVDSVRADIELYKPVFATYKMVADYYLIDDNNQRLTDDFGRHITITI